MISRCWRLSVSLRRSLFRTANRFCERKKIELTEQEWARFQEMMKSLAVESQTDVNGDKLFNSPEQLLSFKLIQCKSAADIVKAMQQQQVDTLTPNMLLLLVYSYSKFGSLSDAAIRPHVQKVLSNVAQLDNSSFVKLFQLVREHREKVDKLPELPQPRQLEPDLLVNLVYILCQLYPSHPQMGRWLQLLNQDNSKAAPNIILSIAILNPNTQRLQVLADKLVECTDDQGHLGKMALLALQNNQLPLAKRLLLKFTPDPSEPDLCINLLCILLDNNADPQLATKMLEQLPSTELYTCTEQSYVSAWTLIRKIKDIGLRDRLVQKLTDFGRYENVTMESMDPDDLFTIFVMCAYLQLKQRDFIDTVGQSLLKNIQELQPDKVLYMYTAADRLKADTIKTTLRPLLEAIQTQLSPNCKLIYSKLP